MSQLPPGSDQSLVRVERMSIRLGSHEVLRDVDLRIDFGETVAVIGESGCGKTVFLKTIIGLLRPTRGAVYFDGKDLARLSEGELAKERMRIGFVFQQAALFDSMTIGQNVAFPLRQHTKMTDREIQEVVRARLSEVGLPESVLRKKPAELSGGMRKRVGLARALVLEPELMLYDEPTTGLDPIMSDVINELMLNTRRRHPVTSVIVTHDMKTAEKVADRVIMLYPLSRLRPDERQVLYDGPPEKIAGARDRRVSQFVRGEAGERLSEMRLHNGSEQWMNV